MAGVTQRSPNRLLFMLTCTVLFLLVTNSLNFKNAGTRPSNDSKWSSLSVHSAVRFKEHVLLLLKNDRSSLALPPPFSSVQCVYGSLEKTTALSINEDWTVVCPHPEKDLAGKSVSIMIDGAFLVPSSAKYPSRDNWMKLVYASAVLDDHVLVFSKRTVTHTKMKRPTAEVISNVRCVFDGGYETNAVEICMENILCNLPPPELRVQFSGRPLTVRFKNKTFSSVALLDLKTTSAVLARQSLQQYPSVSLSKPNKVCACTMIWNVAKYVHEWVSYHSHLGIQRFFFYDNNSDDDIQKVLEQLSERYNVSRHFWPWMKTQEAGFSHCAIRAQLLCEWVLFTDVDEFLYPAEFIRQHTNPSFNRSYSSNTHVGELTPSNTLSIVEKLILDVQSQHPNSPVGSIQILCQDFGPSGLHSLPKNGQMLNYVCGIKKFSRHKSLVRLESLVPTRCGRIHHFDVKQGYQNVLLPKTFALIKHYKYQVWEEFKIKFFHHRVATYVKDWDHEIKYSTNNDRVEGLQSGDVEPQDWATRFCEIRDTSLRDYVDRALRNPDTGLLPWE